MTDSVPVHAVECPAEVFEVGVRVGAQSERVRQADGIAFNINSLLILPNNDFYKLRNILSLIIFMASSGYPISSYAME